MENELEGLLNSLIERGRCPFWKKDVYIETGEWYDFRDWFIVLKRERGWTYTCESEYMPYRMLCTKSSWLWQFVCENMLINKKWFYWDEYCIAEHCEYTPKYYKFRLIESALKDESELEKFLLDNIKIEW